MNQVERPMWRYCEARSPCPARIDAGHVIKNIKVSVRSLGFYLLRDDPHGISWGFGYDVPLLRHSQAIGQGFRRAP